MDSNDASNSWQTAAAILNPFIVLLDVFGAAGDAADGRAFVEPPVIGFAEGVAILCHHDSLGDVTVGGDKFAADVVAVAVVVVASRELAGFVGQAADGFAFVVEVMMLGEDAFAIPFAGDDAIVEVDDLAHSFGAIATAAAGVSVLLTNQRSRVHEKPFGASASTCSTAGVVTFSAALGSLSRPDHSTAMAVYWPGVRRSVSPARTGRVVNRRPLCVRW